MLTRVLTIVLLSAATQPATRPATQPSVEQQLRSIIAGLQQQVASLKTENLDLKRQLEKAKQDVLAAQPPVLPTTPDVADQIKEGMTKADVLKLMVRPPDSEIISSGGISQLTWKFKRPRNTKEMQREFRPAQVDPRNIDLSPSNTEDPSEAVIPAGDVVVFLRNGKVIETRKSKF